MATRRPRHSLVKSNRNYTIDELASLLGVHRNTVRHWLKQGLATIDSKRPKLMLGRHVSEFLIARRSKNKRPCRPGEIYCVRCRCPRTPAGEFVEYSAQTALLGSLVGICPVCASVMHRRVSLASLDRARGGLEVLSTPAGRDIYESATLVVNCDFKGDS